jgi:DHA1 family tetracycline resistance protein-like MFS transporter
LSELPAAAIAPRVRKAALAFIFITVAIDILSFGVIIPVLPHLIERMVGGDISSAARWVGIFGTVFAAIQFIFSPIQGALSDRYGRRPVILLSNLGLGLDFILMALVNTLPLLFIGRVISGITAASFTTANAYIADVTPPEQRAKGYGLLGAAFGLGFVLGPALGGFLGGIDLRLPFYVSAGLALANFLYGYFILPESLPPERRSKRFDWKHASPLGAVQLLRSYPHVLPLALVVVLSNLAHYVLPATFVLYADYRYGWGAQTVGYVLAAVGVCTAIVQLGLVGKVVARLGERRALLTGLVFGTVGFAIYGLAPTGAWFLAGIPVMAIWGIAGPSTQALMTRTVDPAEQGRLQGAVTSLISLAGVFGPLVFASTFAAFIGPRASWQLPGAAYLLSAALLALAWIVAWRSTHAPAPATVDARA